MAHSRMDNIRSLRRAPDEPDETCWRAALAVLVGLSVLLSMSPVGHKRRFCDVDDMAGSLPGAPDLTPRLASSPLTPAFPYAWCPVLLRSVLNARRSTAAAVDMSRPGRNCALVVHL